MILRLPFRGLVWSGEEPGEPRPHVPAPRNPHGREVGVSTSFGQKPRLLPVTGLPTRDSELCGTPELLCRRTDLEGTWEATLKTMGEDPHSQNG